MALQVEKNVDGNGMKCHKRPQYDSASGAIARTGRAFKVVGSPPETWDAAFAELLLDFREAGHQTLITARAKMVGAG